MLSLSTISVTNRYQILFSVQYTLNREVGQKRERGEMLLCRSIYCDGGPGSILHTVQMAKLFPDSKKFVDMKMKHDPAIVRQSFDSMMKR